MKGLLGSFRGAQVLVSHLHGASVCVSIHIHIVQVNTHMYAYIYMCIHTYIYIFTCMDIYVYTYKHIYRCTDMYIHMQMDCEWWLPAITVIARMLPGQFGVARIRMRSAGLRFFSLLLNGRFM